MPSLEEQLTQFLRAHDPKMREVAARMLASLGDVDAIPALIRAGGDADPAVAAEVERALATLWEKATEAERATLVCAAAAGREPGFGEPTLAEVAQVLAAMALREPPGERLAAVRALGGLGAAPAIPPLLHATRDASVEVRVAAIEALTTVAMACPDRMRVVESVLRRALHDRPRAVKQAAHRGLLALDTIAPSRRDRRAFEQAAFVSALRAAPAEEALELLVERGRAIAGRPLDRAEWREIAAALRDTRRGARIAAIVASAERREQVVRALRLARTAAEPSGRGARGAMRPMSAVDRALRDEAGTEHQDDDCKCDMCRPYAGDEWRMWARDAGRCVRGVLPVNAVQAELAAAIAEQRGSLVPPSDFARLRARLDGAERARVFGISHLPEDARAILDRYGLTAWIRAPAAGDSMRTGPELAVVSILDRKEIPFPAREIDWPAIADWLVTRLVQPAEPDALARRVVILAFLRFVADAPRAVRAALRPTVPRIHADWRPLLVPLVSGDADRRGLIEVALGSTLVLHDLAHNLVDLHEQRVPELPHRGSPRDLLRAGAGTLRRLDYPSFRVVSRPAVSLVRPETVSALAEIAAEIARAHAIVATSSPDRLLADLLAHAGSDAFAAVPDPIRQAVSRAVEEHTIAHVVLDNVVLAATPEPVRIRRKHVRRFWADPPPDTPRDLATLRARFDLDRIREGLVAALLDQLHEPWGESHGARLSLKEGFILLLRTIAATYGHIDAPPPEPDEEPGTAAARLVNHLVQQLVHAPLELSQALGQPHEQGLPLLQGGHATPLERRFRQTLREATSSATVAGEREAEASVFTCRPIPKLAAIERGELGRDCSSDNVPLRALSPHHVYYGIFQGEEQLWGYMTVYEAWAERDGQKRPALCLETINVPIDKFDPIQQDLLLIFDAVARSRGLGEEIVLITGIGTWNYQNGCLLEASRRFRRGRKVKLAPADPVSWQLYTAASREAHYYTAFGDDGRGDHRILAPFDPDLDRVQPENREEARRIANLPPRSPIVTARGAEGPMGFISAWPEVL